VRVGEVGVERIDGGQTWAGELVGVDCRLGKCPSPVPLPPPRKKTTAVGAEEQ
jgi:hypothetical protein